MAIDSTLPPAPENRAVAAARGIPGFYRAVMIEMKKVTWPTRRETGITTLMVFIMSAAAAVFFLIADQLIRLAVTTVLGIL